MINIKRITLEVFLLTAICVCFLSPFLQRTLGTVGTLLLILSYLILEVSHFFNIDAYERDTLFLLTAYIVMLLLYSFLGLSDPGAGQTNGVFYLLLFACIVPIYKRLKRQHCVFIIRACVVTTLVTMVQNYFLWLRMGKNFTQQWYRNSGIVEVINTQYVSALMFFSGVLFCMFLYKKDYKNKTLCFALFVVCFLFNVFIPQRTIVVLLSLLMIVLLLLFNGEKTRRRLIAYEFIGLLLILVLVNYDIALNLLSELFTSEKIRTRLIAINTLLSTLDLSMVLKGSLTERIYLMGVSINTFWGSVTNFLFGVGDKINNVLVGNHSYFLDEFAKFGIFGGLLSCTLLIRMLKQVRRMSCVVRQDSLYWLLSVLFLVLVLRSFIGGIMAPSIGVVIFIFTPLAFKILKFPTEWGETDSKVSQQNVPKDTRIT